MTPFFNNFSPPEVISFTSQCPDDFSLKGGQKDLTDEQKIALSSQLGFTITATVNIRQVHGDKTIYISKNKSHLPSETLVESDGIFTDASNLPILVRTADCVPIFLYDIKKRIIGLLHAGWKGTHKEILPKNIKWMNLTPQEVKIAFGPAIRNCCYEVKGDVRDCFSEDIVQRNGKTYLDLVEVNKKQAMKFGVKKENLADCHVCTCCNENYFSYRRQGEKAGRMISLMVLKNEK